MSKIYFLDNVEGYEHVNNYDAILNKWYKESYEEMWERKNLYSDDLMDKVVLKWYWSWLQWD